jgi:hypothetical protein
VVARDAGCTRNPQAPACPTNSKPVDEKVVEDKGRITQQDKGCIT